MENTMRNKLREWFRPRSWGGRSEDHYWGPFTYHRNERETTILDLCLSSAGDEESEGCNLRVTLLGHTVIVALPPILRPYRTKVYAQSWDKATVERMGRDWYWDCDARRYGISLFKDGDGWSPTYLSVHYGRQTHNSGTDRQRGWFVPWTDHRVVRHDHYDHLGRLCYSEPCPSPRWDTPEYEANRKALDALPTVDFAFHDYDDELLVCATRIEEMEWRKGTGRFKWVGRFYKPLVKRTLDLRFSVETGQRKGSWKGGTIGTGIVMLPGELHAAAFARYCAENRMVYVGPMVADKQENSP